MQRGYAPFLYFVAVLGLEAAMQKECRIIEALQNKLTYQQRLQYMKHYFPINYTVNVQFEEVLKAANITRLRDQNVSELSLRYLWLSVNSQVLLKIWAVLLERHPSWEYTQDLCRLFEQLAEEYESYNQLLSGRPSPKPSGRVTAQGWPYHEQTEAATGREKRSLLCPSLAPPGAWTD
ncbi:interleukin-34 isoform X2 [Chelonia mydas]|uniref:interleukin-34 isoform X2 n=1 Tax=Chelonia mydas TaxID=8469 RepID=UPI001CA80DD4|nr:interleukin-34 isoform X2 [Chelonia mydas]